MQMMFEAMQPTPEEKEFRQRELQKRYNEEDYQRDTAREEQKYQLTKRRGQQELTEAQTRQQGYIDELPGLDDATRARTRFGVQMGFKPEQIADVAGINLEGRKDEREQREKITKWGAQQGMMSQDMATMDRAQKRAVELIDKGTMTTGMKGYFGQMAPGSDANRLVQAIEPLNRLIGFERLQQMREQSKTGGALGNVSDTEGRWLASVQGSLDPINNSARHLKENIAGIVEGKKILMHMHALIPAMDAQDAKAWQKYAALAGELQTVGDDISERLNGEERATAEQKRQAKQRPNSAAKQAPAVTISSDEEWARLPSGTLYTAPDGSTRRKP